MSTKSDLGDLAFGVGIGAVVLYVLEEYGIRFLVGLTVGVLAFLFLFGVEDESDDV